MLARQAEVLDGLLSALDAGAEIPLVVFDLDDTLLSTGLRHIRILREFASRTDVRERHREAAALARINRAELCYSILDTAKVAGVLDRALLEELKAFWFERFFTNDYLIEDDAVPGAAEYCRETLARGGKVVYLTGRDETMKEGTMTALARRGFPVPDGGSVELILKPRFDTPDLEFKTEAVARLKSMGTVAGGFENEPAHINLLADAFPEATMVFVDTRHSGKPVTPHPGIPWIKDFSR